MRARSRPLAWHGQTASTCRNNCPFTAAVATRWLSHLGLALSCVPVALVAHVAAIRHAALQSPARKGTCSSLTHGLSWLAHMSASCQEASSSCTCAAVELPNWPTAAKLHLGNATGSLLVADVARITSIRQAPLHVFAAANWEAVSYAARSLAKHNSRPQGKPERTPRSWGGPACYCLPAACRIFQAEAGAAPFCYRHRGRAKSVPSVCLCWAGWRSTTLTVGSQDAVAELHS